MGACSWEREPADASKLSGVHLTGPSSKAEARSRESPIEAMGAALSAVSTSDARGFFEHRGYYLLDHRYEKRSRSAGLFSGSPDVERFLTLEEIRLRRSRGEIAAGEI